MSLTRPAFRFQIVYFYNHCEFDIRSQSFQVDDGHFSFEDMLESNRRFAVGRLQRLPGG
jgi:hypothetical protein